MRSGAPEPRVAQPVVDEQGKEDQAQRDEIPGSELERLERLEERQVDLVDRRDALTTVRDLFAGDLDLVAIDDDAPDDLAEGESERWRCSRRAGRSVGNPISIAIVVPPPR